MRVRLSGEARAFVHREAQYLNAYSRSAALAFQGRMEKARSMLEQFPGIGVAHDGLPIPGLRRLIVDGYLLDYDWDGQDITILSIRHGRQGPPPAEDDGPADYE